MSEDSGALEVIYKPIEKPPTESVLQPVIEVLPPMVTVPHNPSRWIGQDYFPDVNQAAEDVWRKHVANYPNKVIGAPDGFRWNFSSGKESGAISIRDTLMDADVAFRTKRNGIPPAIAEWRDIYIANSEVRRDLIKTHPSGKVRLYRGVPSEVSGSAPQAVESYSPRANYAVWFAGNDGTVYQRDVDVEDIVAAVGTMNSEYIVLNRAALGPQAVTTITGEAVIAERTQDL